MKTKHATIYRVEYIARAEGVDGEHKGFSYHTTRRLADRAAETDNEIETSVEAWPVRISLEGLVSALNRHGGHAKNG